MDKLGLLRELFDNKVIDIIKLFLSNQNKQFYLKEISISVNVPMATTHRILKKLTRLTIIKETSISKFKVYQVAENDEVVFLRSFIKATARVVDIFISEVSEISGIHRIIHHGKEIENRANLLIIGEGIDTTKIKEIVANLQEQYKYYISYMALTEEQYEQMSSMGLYSGQKRILYES